MTTVWHYKLSALKTGNQKGELVNRVRNFTTVRKSHFLRTGRQTGSLFLLTCRMLTDEIIFSFRPFKTKITSFSRPGTCVLLLIFIRQHPRYFYVYFRCPQQFQRSENDSILLSCLSFKIPVFLFHKRYGSRGTKTCIIYATRVYKLCIFIIVRDVIPNKWYFLIVCILYACTIRGVRYYNMTFAARTLGRSRKKKKKNSVEDSV